MKKYRYWCPACKKTVWRDGWRLFHRSYCEKGGRTVLMVVRDLPRGGMR